MPKAIQRSIGCFSHVDVGAAEGAVRGGVGEAVALADLVAAVLVVVHDDRGERGDDRLDLRQLDALALAGLLAVAEGGEDGDQGVAGVDHVVRVVRADAHRRAVGEAAEVVVAGDGVEDGAEAEEVLVGTSRSPASAGRRR